MNSPRWRQPQDAANCLLSSLWLRSKRRPVSAARLRVEARSGRVNRPCGAPIDVRPEVASGLIREYIYLHGAVSPKNGTRVYLIMYRIRRVSRPSALFPPPHAPELKPPPATPLSLAQWSGFGAWTANARAFRIERAP
jgi:hypothetical protein